MSEMMTDKDTNRNSNQCNNYYAIQCKYTMQYNALKKLPCYAIYDAIQCHDKTDTSAAHEE